MKEVEFRNSLEERNRLKTLLQDPTLQRALAIIGDKARPRKIVDPRQHAHLDTITSQHYYHIAGIQYALDRLEKLTEPNPDPIEERKGKIAEMEREPYWHTLPPQMQQALIQLAEKPNTEMP